MATAEEQPPLRATTPPPRVTMGLLDFITAHSLDEDYAHVAEQRQKRAEGSETGPPSKRPTSWLVLIVFGLLVGTAAVQTARTAGVTESSHDNLVGQVTSGGKELDTARERLADVRAEAVRAQRASTTAAVARNQQDAQVARLGLVAGAVPVTGPGVRLRVDNAEGATADENFVLDSDLRDIVNGLWEAGAEAIAINGQRITTTTAIDVAGEVIVVNYVNVLAPYTVVAIGDENSLPARFVESTTGSIWLNNQRRYGLRFSMDNVGSLTLPAVAPARLALQSATNKTDQVRGVS